MNANRRKRDLDQMKPTRDIKSITSKKRSEGFQVQEVKTSNRSLQNTLKIDVKQSSNDEIGERKSDFKKFTKKLENPS